MNVDKLNFDYKQIKNEVTSSWSRCLKHELNRVIKNKNSTYRNNNINSNIIIEIKKYFNNNIKKIYDKLETNSCFFLVNKNLKIEETVADFSLKSYLENYGITKGFSFFEKNSGTNAVFLSKKLFKPVSILPGHHFCKPLNSFYSISYPIITNDKLYGFINIINKKIISNEIICLCDLLVENIELEILHKKNIKENKFYELTERQIYLLKNIANGLTEKAMAEDLHLSISTIKYHKKQLFNLFHANSQIEIVIKAFKNGLITFDEVSF